MESSIAMRRLPKTLGSAYNRSRIAAGRLQYVLGTFRPQRRAGGPERGFLDFICNICGTRNYGVELFAREHPNCTGCRSTVRFRWVGYVLSMELFGTPLPLPDFPTLKGLRGLGMTDPDCYAGMLAEKFHYVNTFYDQEPRLDITDIARQEP